jgi:hypothetical protein
MINLCRRCFSPILEGQLASAVATATYHVLKSKVAYAFDKSDMTMDPDTLIHAKGSDCKYQDAY